jgi:hypothetical protein
MRRNAMVADFSWDRTCQEYVRVRTIVEALIPGFAARAIRISWE